MRIKANTITELNEQLEKHPAIKRLHPGVAHSSAKSGAESALSLKRRIRRALASDPRIGSLVANARRVATCRDEGRALLRKAMAGEKASDRSARQFSRKWAGIEHDYRSALALSYEVVSSNKTLAAFAQAAKDIEDIHRFANPALLGKTERLLLSEMGADVDGLMDAYRYSYLPDRKQVGQAISHIGSRLPMEGRQHLGKMVFLYAPERMLEGGVLTVGGSDLKDLDALLLAIAAATAALQWAIEGATGTAQAMWSASGNWVIFLVLWCIWMDQQQRIAWLKQHTLELEQQYADEAELFGADRAAATVVETPAAVATEFGYVVGNMSKSKLEVHLPTCRFVPLITPDHMRTHSTLAAAHAAGLDNCHFCIGGSLR